MAAATLTRPHTVRCHARRTRRCPATVAVREPDAVPRGWRPFGKGHACPSCARVVLCNPSVGPVMAYAGQRAVDRFTTEGETRHAVTLFALLSGAMDTECGRLAVVEIGPWDPADPDNCTRCARFVAGTERMPKDPPPLKDRPAPALLALAGADPLIQLELFTAA